ncbi:MAG: X-Pro dipeptidyl-peptidase [Gemmatimonadales bacterium]|nr:hypothetical protein HRbin33_00157 [bacterium HR33]GIW51556.1 MAG: X-Pro dipeptidyl-peptidase [Gemmatimonadales bacterium]
MMSRHVLLSVFCGAAILPFVLHPAGNRGSQSQLAAPSELRDTVTLYTQDRAALLRRYEVEYSPARRERMRRFYRDWQNRLNRMDFDRLSQEGKVDYILLANEVRYQLELLSREERQYEEMLPLAPFAPVVMDLVESWRRMESMDPPKAAATLAALAKDVEGARQQLRAVGRTDGSSRRIVAFRTLGMVENLRRILERWNGFYSGYDPMYSWWAADPYKRADQALADYLKALREEVLGFRPGQEEPIIADPIGAEGIRADLSHEMIPYSLEELVAIAEQEFAWCEAEFKKAAREMGFGDDWRAALEKVKQSYVEPGKQPDLVRDLAREAEEFVERRDLVTVPPLAKEIWRMEMMSPERQRVSPFFLGGEVIRISYPTDGMTHEEKLMSMRGNNPYFSRATVHHELIPGHHLQGFMTSRYNSHRQAFSTPFWGEGWALYWEMLLWDLGFPRTPEEKIGMLFWRSHRAARIIFSLSVHLGTMTPEEAIEFLVQRVGHERANAAAEVRRSFNGTYPPLYQAAYMLGGLQFRALHRELVESGKMTNRQFHDAILRGGRMPVEMVRARLTGERLTRDYRSRWRFAEVSPPAR